MFVHSRKLRFVERAPRNEGWRALHRAAESKVPAAEQAFRAALEATRRATSIAAIRAALERGADEIAVSAINWTKLERALEDKLLPILTGVAQRGGTVAARELSEQLGERFPVKKAGGELGYAFDLVNPEVVAELSRHGVTLVTRITNETRMAIKEVVMAAQQRGLSVRDQAERIARILRQSVGLNAPQARALANYEALLREQERTEADIRGLLARRRDQFIDQRARVIARNETLWASNAGQHDVWRQAQEGGLLATDQKRKWLTQGAVNPSNPCPICKPMNGQIRGMTEDFVSPYNGVTVRHPPAHISCVCVATLIFDD